MTFIYSKLVISIVLSSNLNFKSSPYDANISFRCSHCCDCRRKSLSGNWKTNLEQSVLEEVPVEDRYKQWIDKVRTIISSQFIHQAGF